MKKSTIILLLAALVLVLGGLAAAHFTADTDYPSQAADGAAWDESWQMLGPVMGVEPPGNGFVLWDDSAMLSADDIFYTTWVAGESSKFTNGDGDEVNVYDAQLYMLAVACADGDSARQTLEEWMGRGSDTYTVRQQKTQVCNGQEYTLLYYDCISETDPFQRGVTAFTVYGNYAISAELSCRESFQGDEAAILPDVLGRCHYSADIS